jgi:hypothetical protein
MERCIRKSAGNGLEQGFGPTAMVEPAASAAVRDPQRAEGPQPLLYTPHWVYEQTDGEDQNGNSGLKPTGGKYVAHLLHGLRSPSLDERT